MRRISSYRGILLIFTAIIISTSLISSSIWYHEWQLQVKRNDAYTNEIMESVQETRECIHYTNIEKKDANTTIIERYNDDHVMTRIEYYDKKGDNFAIDYFDKNNKKVREEYDFDRDGKIDTIVYHKGPYEVIEKIEYYLTGGSAPDAVDIDTTGDGLMETTIININQNNDTVRFIPITPFGGIAL